jgi:uncharacterized protein YndB with AHSA1/START domain
MTKSPVRAVADLSEGVILAAVDIAVPPSRVFEALTSDEITRWWGADDLYRTTKYTADLRVGGKWRTEGVGADGTPFFVEGEFVAIEPPHRLVQTWRAPWDGGNTTTITYRFDATPTGTRLTLRHTGFAGRPESCAGHANGWERVLGWLVGHVAPAVDSRKFFLCRLIAPRSTFPFDMTAEEQQLMAQHVAYWRSHLVTGTAVVFGPVADPAGVWGLGVMRAMNAEEIHALQAKDPIILANRSFRYETIPMLQAIAGDA